MQDGADRAVSRDPLAGLLRCHAKVLELLGDEHHIDRDEIDSTQDVEVTGSVVIVAHR